LTTLGIEDNEDKIDIEPRPEGRGLRPRVKRMSIGIPSAIPMIILLYLTATSDPLMKIPIKSFTMILVVTLIIVSTIVMAGIGLYYMAYKRFD